MCLKFGISPNLQQNKIHSCIIFGELYQYAGAQSVQVIFDILFLKEAMSFIILCYLTFMSEIEKLNHLNKKQCLSLFMVSNFYVRDRKA